ncbi:MAG TPA: tripartite tricarboxylate transporter substrate-binding protein [Gemmataceae bacterium]
MRRKFVILFAGCLALAGCRKAERYPERPLTLICPWAAGGGTDRVSRQIAVGLERELGVPVNVVNATGGAGVTGHARGALARPDGYTLTTITPELCMLHWRGMTDITFRDFRPLMSVNGDPAALFVRDDSELATAGDLVGAIRSRPGEVKASGSAFGSIWHVAVAGWMTSMGLRPDDVIWVSVNGANPSLQELIAGTVDVVCCSVPEAQTLLDAGKIRCVAVMADERLTELPGVPTLREEGYDWSLSGWRGIALPNGVPEERAGLLLEALRKVVTGPEYLDFLKKSGFGARADGPEAFARTLEGSDEQFGAIFRSDAFASVQRQHFGPMFFPAILGGLFLLALGGAYVTGRLRRDAESPPITRAGRARIAVLIGALLFYVLAAEYLGFVPAAAAVMLVLMRALEVRWLVALAVTAGLVPAVYQLFAVVLRVPLPWGLLGW